MKSVIISAMFFKWIKLPILVVLALIIHLFSAQHDSASALVLCFGDDGHVAFELVQQQNAHVNSQTDQVDVCSESTNCHDVLLTFSHQEMIAPPTFESNSLQSFLNLVHHTSLVYAFLELQNLAEVSLQPINRAETPTMYLKHRASFAQTQTLKNTILTI
jgi:hypothetical protein